MPVKVCHSGHRKRWREFHHPIRFVRAVLAVELSFWCEGAVEVTYGHTENLQAQGDALVAAQMGNNC